MIYLKHDLKSIVITTIIAVIFKGQITKNIVHADAKFVKIPLKNL